MTFSDNPALTIWMTVSLVMTSCPETDAVELTRRHAASRREARSSCVLNALRMATSRVIWHPVVEEITDASVMKAIGAAGCQPESAGLAHPRANPRHAPRESSDAPSVVGYLSSGARFRERLPSVEWIASARGNSSSLLSR